VVLVPGLPASFGIGAEGGVAGANAVGAGSDAAADSAESGGGGGDDPGACTGVPSWLIS